VIIYSGQSPSSIPGSTRGKGVRVRARVKVEGEG